MALALRLARRGEGCTRPNPPVGAVLTRAGRVVGQGWHRRAGGPHAEIYALRQAGARARGATLYVTLEPCSTSGRTPPCTAALIAAGVRRVVAAVTDPNPRHRGRGLALLRRAGIAVKTGVRREEAQALLDPFARRMIHGRPYLTLKLGQTLDGRIADAAGCSKWVTGVQARREVQALRRRCDVVLVGAGTVLADDPSLLPRPPLGRHPWRVIVDARGRVRPGARVFSDGAAAQTVLATTAACPTARRRAYARAGAAVWMLPADAHGRVSLTSLMERLQTLGALHVLCEGGGELASSLLAERLVDEAWIFLAPLFLGGDGVAAVAGAGWRLTGLPRWRVIEQRLCGKDLLVRVRPEGKR